MTPLAGVWGVLAAFFTFLAVTTEMLLWVVIAVISLTAAVVSCFAPEAAKIAAVPAPRRVAGKSPTSGVRRNSGKAASRPGTRKKPPCGARCRRSTKPAKSCDCICNGSAHGSEVGRMFTGSRAEATLKSKQNRIREKQHVREREAWRK